MRAIELNQIQKEKLLEMCKILFSEFKEIKLELEDNYEGTQNFVQLTKINWGDTIYIHWYEFVINHLADKVFQMKSLSPIHLINQKKKFGADIMCGIDPINYLYEIFKETK